MPAGTRRGSLLAAMLLGLELGRVQGWRSFAARLADVGYWAPAVFSESARVSRLDIEYADWLAGNEPTPAELARMRKESATWLDGPRISVIMPVYNPPAAVLREAIESLLAQVYPDWELCVADDCSTLPHVRPLLEEYRMRDPRIRVTYREMNGRICAASNSALALATGNFVGFLDHDDLLAPQALYEFANRIRSRPEADVLYSDEDMLLVDGHRGRPFFKPDWSPELLLACNYISHFCVIRSSIVEQVGGFRAECEGSQDYDLVLRASEVARQIVHIPKQLYTWRQSEQSTALTGGAKPYAFSAARVALKDALIRRGVDGSVSFGRNLGSYETRISVSPGHRVTLILAQGAHDAGDVRKCLGSIRKRTGYRWWTAVIVSGTEQPAPANPDAQTRASRRLRHVTVRSPETSNRSNMLNAGARAATGDYVLFVDHRVRAVSRDWIERLIEYAQDPGVGVVGPRVVGPGRKAVDDGVVVGVDGFASSPRFADYLRMPYAPRNCSAVSGACMLMRREVFEELGGFDEQLGAWDAVDLCLRAGRAGYRIVQTPYARLRLINSKGPRRGSRRDDAPAIYEKWGRPGEYRDPYYNPNFDSQRVFHLRPSRWADSDNRK
jgi:GT2 family glycosyltransferase